VSSGRFPEPAQPVSAEERRFIGALEHDYAWSITQRFTDGGEIVAGTKAAAEAAEFLAEEMRHIGLLPGLPDGRYIENFPIHGWEDLGTSVTVLGPQPRTIPCKQAYKAAGTGPEGVTAPLVFVGLARWEDFERHDVRGKIVLLHRMDPMFYALPSLAEAMARGAVGALIDSPILAEQALKVDMIGVSIPAAYISRADSEHLQEMLRAGPEVTVKLVVHNRVGHGLTGHNVIGLLPGTTYPNELVYLAAHFDHWFTSACDDNAGMGSLLAIAKAIVKAGLKPARTLVFAAFDAEELGGPPDIWYEWCLGSYSHIIKTLDGRVLHPDRPGRIAAMLNMDVVGVRGAVVMAETTPDLTRFIASVAKASGLSATVPTNVYWPPSSYDDWPFYLAGVPVMQIAWWGPAYDPLYHATEDTMDKIAPENLWANMVFNGLCLLRLAQAKVLPYDLAENLEVARRGIENLLANDPSAIESGRADIEPLQAGMEAYRAAFDAARTKLEHPSPSAPEVGRLNGILMRSARALNPDLFDWDLRMIPGWTGLFLFDAYATNLRCLTEAIEELRRGRTEEAATALAGVVTMEWGQHVGEVAYAHVLREIAFPEHPLWAENHLPVLTQIHPEYMSLRGRSGGHAMTPQEVLARLTEKREAIYRSITTAALKAGAAYRRAAEVLAEI